MKLVICEKPSVAKAVASAPGCHIQGDGCFEGNGAHRFLVRGAFGVPDGRSRVRPWL